MDRTDFRLLVCLHEDARQSYRSLGRTVGLSAPAVKSRIRRLESRGILQGFWVSVPPSLFGRDDVLLFFRGNVPRETAKALLSEPDVAWVASKVDGGLTVQVWPPAGRRHDPGIARAVGARASGTAVAAPAIVPRPSRLGWRVLRALVEDPRVGIGEIGRATGLSPKTIRRNLKSLIQGGAVNIMPRLGAFRDSGDIVYHLAVVGDAPLADLRRILGDVWLVNETLRPRLRYLLCRADDVTDATFRAQRVQEARGVSSVTATLTREMLVNDGFLARLVDEQTESAPA